MSSETPGTTAPVPLTEKARAAQIKRQEAEAKALRANLLRRKQQQRARPEGPSPTDSAGREE